jgi:hypothetical protein
LSRGVTPPLEDSAFTYGFNGDYLKTVGEYWLKEYNWKASGEKILNKMGKHFKTRQRENAIIRSKKY